MRHKKCSIIVIKVTGSVRDPVALSRIDADSLFVKRWSYEAESFKNRDHIPEIIR